MGADLVVVGGEAVELGPELVCGGGRVLAGQVFLEGLGEALDLAAGLGVENLRPPSAPSTSMSRATSPAHGSLKQREL